MRGIRTRVACVLMTLALAMPNTTAAAADTAAAKDSRVYEMRVYWAAPGKLDALLAQMKLFHPKLIDPLPQTPPLALIARRIR